ncbi:hypothetical protein DLAC_02321 [Tieghemostelium lacteum]|uniref:Uncharacterized protein n=1 Tax=Tieghemostelium lacteum TaxID=361077 RepID=A0A152A4P3_TIELA|nr:hypothetical protein DLAC_02321 [Tieghemostelium lacteum]|eukprot:KYR01203.1 hypothetical protein DLAC_02321 [Tieghemostelium lacteum]
MNPNNNNQTTITTTTSSSTNIRTQQVPNAFTLTEGTTAQQIIDHLKIPEGDDKSNISKFNLNGSSLLNPEITLDILVRTLGISLPTTLSLLALRPTTPSVDIEKWFQVQQKVTYHPIETSELAFNFYDRADAINAIYDVTKKHLQSKPGERGEHKFLLAAGAPGIGKTRLLLEYGQLVHQQLINNEVIDIDTFMLTLYITFGNGSYWLPSESVETGLSLRLLASYFQVNWDIVRTTITKNVNFIEAMGIIMNDLIQKGKIKDKGAILYLGVDEFQTLLVKRNENYNDKSLLKHLTAIIGNYLLQGNNAFPLVPILAGTLYSEISEVFTSSGHPYFQIPLKLISHQFSLEMVFKHYENNIVVKNLLEQSQHQLEMCLYQFIGWPRPLVWFILNIEKFVRDDNQHLLYKENLMSTRSAIIERYSFPITDIAEIFIAHSITLTSVHPMQWAQKCDLLQNQSYELFESMGFITRQIDSEHQFIPIMPLIFINWSTVLSSGPFRLLHDLLESMDKDYTWSDWEGFCSKFTLLKSQMFIRLGKTTVSLQDFFGKPISPQENSRLHFQLELKPGEFIELKHQYPSSIFNTFYFKEVGIKFENTKLLTHSNVFLNAKSAPWGDWFSIYNKSGSDSAIVLVGQGKHRKQNTPLTENDIIVEYNKIKQQKLGLPTHTFMVLMTNTKAPSRISPTPYTFIIDNVNSGSFFGPIFNQIIPKF